jgi:predicted alpha/beta-fold hydrolase
LRKAWFLAGLPGISSDVGGTAEFLRKEAGGARRIVLTGYSLGGFAAHLYASLLENAEAVTFSPQTFVSFWQRLRARDHRWRRYALALLWKSKARYRDLRPFLVRQSRVKHAIHYAVDSPLDAVHAQRVASLQNVRVIAHTEGRHRLVTALRDSGELRKLLESAVRGERSD